VTLNVNHHRHGSTPLTMTVSSILRQALENLRSIPSCFDSAQHDGGFDPETSSGKPSFSMTVGLNVPLLF